MWFACKSSGFDKKIKDWIYVNAKKLLPQSLDDCSDKEGCKKALCHSAKSVNKITLYVLVHKQYLMRKIKMFRLIYLVM